MQLTTTTTRTTLTTGPRALDSTAMEPLDAPRPQDIALVKRVRDEEVTFFIEQELERHLEIPELAVRGAWSQAQLRAEQLRD